MNVCVEYEALLDLYVDGGLDTEEMLRVQEHLDACPACRAYVDDLFTIRAEFPDEDSVPLPEGFHERVMAGIAADAAKAKKKRRFTMFAPLAAACLALMVAVNGGPSAKKESAAAAPVAARYSLTANEPAAAPAASAPAAGAPAPATECPAGELADMETQLDGTAEAAYFATLTVTREEAEEHLASFEAMEWKGQEAFELAAAEYAVLLTALGMETDALPGEGKALVIIQE